MSTPNTCCMHIVAVCLHVPAADRWQRICAYLCQMTQGTRQCCQAVWQLDRRHTAAVQAVYHLLGSWQQHCQRKGLCGCWWQTWCHPAHSMSQQALVYSNAHEPARTSAQHGSHHTSVYPENRKAEQSQIMCRLCRC